MNNAPKLKKDYDDLVWVNNLLLEGKVIQAQGILPDLLHGFALTISSVEQIEGYYAELLGKAAPEIPAIKESA